MMGWWHGFVGGPGLNTSFASIWGIAGILSMLVFLAVAVVLTFLVVRAFAGSRRGVAGGESTAYATPAASPNSTALVLLKERYARGEITRAEYQEVRHSLGV